MASFGGGGGWCLSGGGGGQPQLPLRIAWPPLVVVAGGACPGVGVVSPSCRCASRGLLWWWWRVVPVRGWGWSAPVAAAHRVGSFGGGGGWCLSGGGGGQPQLPLRIAWAPLVVVAGGACPGVGVVSPSCRCASRGLLWWWWRVVPVRGWGWSAPVAAAHRVGSFGGGGGWCLSGGGGGQPQLPLRIAWAPLVVVAGGACLGVGVVSPSCRCASRGLLWWWWRVVPVRGWGWSAPVAAAHRVGSFGGGGGWCLSGGGGGQPQLPLRIAWAPLVVVAGGACLGVGVVSPSCRCASRGLLWWWWRVVPVRGWGWSAPVAAAHRGLLLVPSRRPGLAS